MTQPEPWHARDSLTATTPPLAELLAVESTGLDTFVGQCRAGARRRIFGGQLIAQALMAAGATVDRERAVHSLHAGFVDGGDNARPVHYRVRRLRDGGSFSTRVVEAYQDERIVLHLLCSFQRPEAGWEYEAPAPVVPEPQTLPPDTAGPFDLRVVRWLPEPAGDGPLPSQFLWFQSTDPLPDDQLSHAAALAFLSDLTVGWAIWKQRGIHGVTPDMFSTSLDHAMWFHRPVRADEWMLLSQHGSTTTSGRGLNNASIFGADGRQAVTIVQECLMRASPRPVG